jgi:hypothetical protein
MYRGAKFIMRCYLKLSAISLLLCFLWGGHSAAADCPAAPPDEELRCMQNDGWKLEQEKEGIRTFMRRQEGSSIYEIMARLTISAYANNIFEIIMDFDRYTEFMPDTLELCKVEGQDDQTYWVFQQLKLPLISDRYYTIKLTSDVSHAADGRYRLGWTLADPSRYPRQGRGVRVDFNNGYWSLAQQGERAVTDVTYYIYTDPGGSVWDWVVNLANKISVPDVVKSVWTRAEEK